VIESVFESERWDLQFIPHWFVAWLQDNKEPERQTFALQTYSCCLAEYYSARLGLPEPSIFDGLDWAIERTQTLLCQQRNEMSTNHRFKKSTFQRVACPVGFVKVNEREQANLLVQTVS
jgi:hypothetical protein